MKKKCLKMIILALTCILLSTAFSHISKSKEFSNDQIDQEQDLSSGKDYIYSDHWKAQSFKPTTYLLTRIQLYMNKIGNVGSDFEIIIKSSLTGNNLVSLSTPVDDIPISESWVTFDIPDISVSVGQTYYILCKTESGDQFNSYNWYEAYSDLYGRGIKYYSNDSGNAWYQRPDSDFCFKTYGKKAELEISYLTGGARCQLFYGIKNIGTSDATDVEIEITISGGLVLTRKSYTYIHNETLTAGGAIDEVISPVIGLGPTSVTIAAESAQTQRISKTFDAFLLIFYVYVQPG